MCNVLQHPSCFQSSLIPLRKNSVPSDKYWHHLFSQVPIFPNPLSLNSPILNSSHKWNPAVSLSCLAGFTERMFSRFTHVMCVSASFIAVCVDSTRCSSVHQLADTGFPPLGY